MCDILTKDWGTSQIEILGPAIEMRPTEIHLKRDGAVGNKPSITIVMEHPIHGKVVGQVSLEMLNEAMNELGYTIIEP